MNFSSEAELKDFIIEKGCFEPEENLKILGNTFVPAYRVFNRLSQYFNFNGKKVLDLGCGYGEFLINFEESSLGIDVQDRLLEFASSLGMRVIRFNVEETLDLDEKYEVLFCRQLLDHLVAPHKLLVESHRLLQDEGYLIASIDNIDCPLRRKIASEHLYGFNLKALKILIQRAGFNIIKLLTVTSNKPRIVEKIVNAIPSLLNLSVDIYVIAVKEPNYKYPEKRLPWFSPSWLTSELDGYSDQA